MNVTTIGAGNVGRGIGHRLVYQRADGVLPNICFQHLSHTCAMLPLTKGSYLVDSRAPLARHSHNVGLVLAVMSSIGERVPWSWREAPLIRLTKPLSSCTRCWDGPAVSGRGNRPSSAPL